MSFIETVKITAADGPTIDAFARLRVSDPYTVFDSKQVHDDQPLFWANALTGTGSAAYLEVDARTRLSVTSLNDQVIRQTKQYFNYQPGKSQLMFITGLFKQETNVEKEIGSDDGVNGITLFINGTTDDNIFFRIKKNSSVAESVAKTAWNVDKFDGTGPSGKTLDLNYTQIIYIDFEWLGVGRVRCGFVIDGVPYIAHQFVHANHTGNDSVYMSNPNLPLRYRIKSNGGTGSLDHICASIISEGGQQNTGVLRSVDSGISGNAIASNAYEPMIAIRHQSAKKTATIILKTISVITTTSASFKWAILLNPTSSVGTDFTTGFTAILNSAAEFKSTFTGTITDENIKVASGYASSTSDSVSSDVESFLRIGTNVSTGTQDVVVLAVANISTNSDTFLGSMTFREIA